MTLLKQVTIVCCLALHFSGTQILRDAANRHGSVSNALTFEFDAANVPQLVQRSELVLESRINSQIAHLSTDETYVQTDYEDDFTFSSAITSSCVRLRSGKPQIVE